MMSEKVIDVWKLFETYKTDAPKNLKELEAFEKKCRMNDYEEVADYLENWRLNLEYHITKEFSVDKNDAWKVCDKGHILNPRFDYCNDCLADDFGTMIEKDDDGQSTET